MMKDVNVYPDESLHALITRLTAGPLIAGDKAALDNVTQHVHVWLTHADLVWRQPHVLFDGCKAVSGIAKQYETGDPSSHGVRIIFKTEFHPGPQWKRHPGKADPLGHFDGFDLYLAEVSANEKAVVARRGDRDVDYAMPNPALMHTAAIYADDPPTMRALEEAHRRAKLLHLLP
jgi:hypothetical protein